MDIRQDRHRLVAARIRRPTPENGLMIPALARHIFAQGTDGRSYTQIRESHDGEKLA
ncbi:MAG TPA: hypothetical protein VNZ26_13365 [Vicinamibacterales bacterium]|nr:hypothetical protein [Vicinamibacterales bacterium]